MEQPHFQKLKVQMKFQHSNGEQKWAYVFGGNQIYGATFEKKCQEAVKQLKKLPHPFKRAILVVDGSMGQDNVLAEYDFEQDIFTKEKYPNKHNEVHQKPISALPEMALRASINGKFKTLFVRVFGVKLDDKINNSMERLRKEFAENPNMLLDNCYLYLQGMGRHADKLVATYDKKSDSFIVEPKYRCLLNQRS